MQFYIKCPAQSKKYQDTHTKEQENVTHGQVRKPTEVNQENLTFENYHIITKMLKDFKKKVEPINKDMSNFRKVMENIKKWKC